MATVTDQGLSHLNEPLPAAVEDVVQSQKLVIAAASLGTALEFYDFYLFGLLASYISATFFSGVNETTGFILALATFSAGFAVRPFGALVFGRIGDLVGRKHTFLVTMVIIGVATFAVGILPSYNQIGFASPAILVTLRLLQGLAIGGEYGGATTYVAEYAPPNRRGLYTGFIQITASLGFILSLMVVIFVRFLIGETEFAAWGWRVPFIASLLMLAVSLWIRLQLNESPVFRRMKAEGKTSKAPLTEAFGQWKNLKWVLVVLFGAVAGQAVIGYTGQVYAIFFLEKTLKVDGETTNILFTLAFSMAVPFMIFFGWLSDKVGRKPLLVTGCMLAALSYFPLYGGLTQAANPALARALATSRAVVVAPQAECSFQFDPLGSKKFDEKGCDIAKTVLARSGISYANQDVPAGTRAEVRVGKMVVTTPDVSALDATARKAAIEAFTAQLRAVLARAGYPDKADPAAMNKPMVVLILWTLGMFVALVFGTIAAMLVEIFPARIRYSAMSLPYHLGNGWIGGFLPTTAFAMVAASGDIYSGLWYPVIVAGACAIIGFLFLPETFRRDITA
jgi:MFS family permease